jgi:hypothetical protein
MKGLIVASFLLVGLMNPAFGQQAFTITLEADAPFAFQVAGTYMPAGEYRVAQLSTGITVLALRSIEPGLAAAMHMFPTINKARSTEGPRLVFNKYGEDRYFLSEVWWGTGGTVLPKSQQEREVITTRVIASGAPERVTLAARIVR